MRLLYTLGLLLLFVNLSFSCFGQRQITVRILDSETKKSVDSAKVTVQKSEISALSNALGYFQINADTTDNLVIQRSGYEESLVKVPSAISFQIHLKRVPKYNVPVESPPEFPGGLVAMARYIDKARKYPLDARKKNIEGKVYVEFVLDSSGNVIPESVKVKESLFPSCDEEAIRVVKSFPTWIPGMQDGKGVKVRYVLPISFP